MTDLLTQRYRRSLTSPSDVQDHLRTFVSLVVRRDYRTVIELGTRGGVSTVAWLHALAQTGGHLWTVDLAGAPPLDGLAGDRWTHVQGNDLHPAVLAELPDPADLVFVDTSHCYRHTLGELDTYVPRVRSGGILLFHDTNLRVGCEDDLDLSRDGPFPVRRALDEYCTSHGLSWTENPACYGLGRLEL